MLWPHRVECQFEVLRRSGFYLSQGIIQSRQPRYRQLGRIVSLINPKPYCEREMVDSRHEKHLVRLLVHIPLIDADCVYPKPQGLVLMPECSKCIPKIRGDEKSATIDPDGMLDQIFLSQPWEFSDFLSRYDKIVVF